MRNPYSGRKDDAVEWRMLLDVLATLSARLMGQVESRVNEVTSPTWAVSLEVLHAVAFCMKRDAGDRVTGVTKAGTDLLVGELAAWTGSSGQAAWFAGRDPVVAQTQDAMVRTHEGCPNFAAGAVTPDRSSRSEGQAVLIPGRPGVIHASTPASRTS